MKSNGEVQVEFYNKEGTIPLQLVLPIIPPHLPTTLSGSRENAHTVRLAKHKNLHQHDYF